MVAQCQEIAVLGIGNVLLGDDGVGIHAVRALASNIPELPSLHFLDGGTLSFALAPEIESCDGLIVIDAAELQAAPGALRLFEGAAMDAFLGSHRKRSVHEVGLLDLMAVAALSERLPARRALIAVQPALIDWSDAPSAAVAAAIPEICAHARALIAAWRQ